MHFMFVPFYKMVVSEWAPDLTAVERNGLYHCVKDLRCQQIHIPPMCICWGCFFFDHSFGFTKVHCRAQVWEKLCKRSRCALRLCCGHKPRHTTSLCVPVCVYVSVLVHMCLGSHVCTHTQTQMCKRKVFLYTYMFICVCVYMFVHKHKHKYTYKYKYKHEITNVKTLIQTWKKKPDITTYITPVSTCGVMVCVSLPSRGPAQLPGSGHRGGLGLGPWVWAPGSGPLGVDCTLSPSRVPVKQPGAGRGGGPGSGRPPALPADAGRQLLLPAALRTAHVRHALALQQEELYQSGQGDGGGRGRVPVSTPSAAPVRFEVCFVFVCFWLCFHSCIPFVVIEFVFCIYQFVFYLFVFCLFVCWCVALFLFYWL